MPLDEVSLPRRQGPDANQTLQPYGSRPSEDQPFNLAERTIYYAVGRQANPYIRGHLEFPDSGPPPSALFIQNVTQSTWGPGQYNSPWVVSLRQQRSRRHHVKIVCMSFIELRGDKAGSSRISSGRRQIRALMAPRPRSSALARDAARRHSTGEASCSRQKGQTTSCRASGTCPKS
jgi:hypothetical protein